MAVVEMKSLLEAGVHFGHQTKRWNPKMAEYIFSERNGIHIIDLSKTTDCIVKAYDAIREQVQKGKTVLFVGTKKQAQQTIQSEAERCGMPYVNNRWLGGMLTNFTTIKKSISKLKKIEKMSSDGTFGSLTKKEVSLYSKEKAKLEKNLGGIKNMTELPGIIFIIDTRKEGLAIAEAKQLGIPVVAVVDTNCDPTDITYPIPGNDDAIRAISLFVEIISNAVLDADNDAGIQIITSLPDMNQQELADVPQDAKDAKEDYAYGSYDLDDSQDEDISDDVNPENSDENDGEIDAKYMDDEE